MRRFMMVVRRDLNLALRQGMDSAMVVAFFVIAVVLFPFGVGPEPGTLARIAAGVILVAALLASLLSLDRLFQADLDDGSLELFAYLIQVEQKTLEFQMENLSADQLAPLARLLACELDESVRGAAGGIPGYFRGTGGRGLWWE